VLEAKVRPLGSFPITLDLEPRAEGGTLVRMTEEATGPLGRVPGNETAIGVRNTFSLRRLKQLAEGTT
jgi:hypothetical protein